MMELTITDKVDSHRSNQRYRCLVIDLLREPWFHYQIQNGRLVKADIMPSDDWSLELAERLARISPTFREQLFDLKISLPLPPRPTGPVRKFSGKLADVLQ